VLAAEEDGNLRILRTDRLMVRKVLVDGAQFSRLTGFVRAAQPRRTGAHTRAFGTFRVRMQERGHRADYVVVAENACTYLRQMWQVARDSQAEDVASAVDAQLLGRIGCPATSPRK